MKQIFRKYNVIVNIYLSLTKIANNCFLPLMLLCMRCWMASIFWYSGVNKIDSWDSTLYLFQYEYSVPVIPYQIAAILSTIVELSAPIALVMGLATRIAAIALLCMTAVIQFTYLDLAEHIYWAFLLSTIILSGPGFLSVDHIIYKKVI